MTPLLAIATGATLGAASSLHCAAMCGPLAAVACNGERGIDRSATLQYLGGRALGYAIVGAIAGAVGAPLVAGASAGVVRVVIAGMIAAVLATRAIAWLRPAGAPPLVRLRLAKPRPGLGIVARILPLLPRRGVGLGLATAIFPCGALIGGVVGAAATGSAPLGALAMVGFAFGSAPLLLAPALASARLSEVLRGGVGRKIAGLAMLAVAIWIVAVPTLALARPSPAKTCCHRGP
jgi:sulfite exporter TauE/SafE